MHFFNNTANAVKISLAVKPVTIPLIPSSSQSFLFNAFAVLLKKFPEGKPFFLMPIQGLLRKREVFRNRLLRSTPCMPRSDEVVCILFQILYNLLEDICPVTHLHSDRPDLFFLPSSESKTSLLHQSPALLFLNEVRNF